MSGLEFGFLPSQPPLELPSRGASFLHPLDLTYEAVIFPQSLPGPCALGPLSVSPRRSPIMPFLYSGETPSKFVCGPPLVGSTPPNRISWSFDLRRSRINSLRNLFSTIFLVSIFPHPVWVPFPRKPIQNMILPVFTLRNFKPPQDLTRESHLQPNLMCCFFLLYGADQLRFSLHDFAFV